MLWTDTGTKIYAGDPLLVLNRRVSLTTTATFSHVQWPRILLIAMLC